VGRCAGEGSRRAAAYIRESTEEQGQGFSPDAQREAIRRFAAENGLELVEEYCDFHSGWKKSEKRTDFQRLLGDAAEARFDVVLVYHTSRFARSQVEAKSYKQLLRDRLGVNVVSVTQPLGEDPSDPSTFLAESIHEIFDEYYSVSLSFWTKTGLREKARQGYLVGSLPWGYKRNPHSGLVVPDPERAPLVRQMFALYAQGGHSDRSVAIWLNARGAQTAKGNPFTKDTVREMLVNAAYAGYVTSRRSKDTSIRGQHEPLVDLALFGQVQEIRLAKAATLHPGRPSRGYAISKLLVCERCGSRMHGSAGGRKNERRYYCAKRKQDGSCDQPIVKAEALEEALAEYVRAFAPPKQVRLAVIRRLKQAASLEDVDSDKAVRSRISAQLERLKDLYVIGDLTKDQYTYRRQVLQQELATLQPPQVVDVSEAAAALTNFGLFWEREQDPAERNKLLRIIFESVTQDDGHLVSVTPREAFLPYFMWRSESGGEIRERRDSNPRPPA
jgi:site-specific DNA recombinase